MFTYIILRIYEELLVVGEFSCESLPKITIVEYLDFLQVIDR